MPKRGCHIRKILPLRFDKPELDEVDWPRVCRKLQMIGIGDWNFRHFDVNELTGFADRERYMVLEAQNIMERQVSEEINDGNGKFE